MLQFYLAVLDTDEERIKMSEIYETYQPLMLRYALKITQSQQLAEDAVHDAFLAIIKHKEKYFSKCCTDLRNSIVIIVKRKCIDLLRKTNPMVDEPIDDMEHLLKSEDTPIEEHIVLTEEYEMLRKHVSKLDETSQIILEMRYILGMSHKEISEELNMTLSHVNTKIVRAKAKVRKLIITGGELVEQQTS